MFRARRAFVLFVLCVLAVLVPRVAAAACEPGNLLARAASGPPEAATLIDGVIAREGAPWPEPSVAVSARRALTWDLGRVEDIATVFLQTDADQPIDLEISTDGESWTKRTLPPHPTATGMFGRVIALRQSSRFLRLSAPRDFAVTEVIAACPGAPEPLLQVAEEPDLRVAEDGASDLSAGTVDAMKLVIVIAALALVLLGQMKSKALVALAVVAALAYFDFGAFHRPSFVHDHDVFHYYVGSRYFSELGYDGLYDCAATAEAEAGFGARIELRAQRDLRTNALVSGAEVLKREGECRARFTGPRWTEFTRDVRSFASRRDVHDWHRVLKDHGFNATPAWIAASAPFSRGLARPAFRASFLVALLDPLLLVVAFAAVFWAFGREVGCLAIVAFACNPLAEYAWLGGAFLRQAWLAALLVGLALLARRRGIVAGITLAFAGLLQLFPLVCLIALAGAAIVARWRKKAVDPATRRALLAAAVTLAVAMPASGFISGRAGSWSAFVENTSKHAATPAANLVGLPSALSFRPSTRADVLFDERAVDPFAKVRAARKENFAPLRPLHVLAVLAAIVALLRCFRSPERHPRWWASALGITLVPLALETSSYYTAFIVVTVLLAHEAREGRRLLALPALGAIGLWLVARLAGLTNDVYYAVASVVLVAAVGAILFLANRKFEEPSE